MTSDLPDPETNNSEHSSISIFNSRMELSGDVTDRLYPSGMQLTSSESLGDAEVYPYQFETEMIDEPQPSHHNTASQEPSIADPAPYFYHFPPPPLRPTHIALTEDVGSDYNAELIDAYESPLQLSQLSGEFEDDFDPDNTRQFYLGDLLEDMNLVTGRNQIPPRRAVDQSWYGRNNSENPDPRVSSVVRGFNMHEIPDNRDAVFEGDDVNHHFDTPIHGSTFERNLTIEQFIREWAVRSKVKSPQEDMRFYLPYPSSGISDISLWSRPPQITRPPGCRDPFFDIQQIPWREKLRVDRSEARALRDSWYTSYHNLKYTYRKDERSLPNSELYFREHSMYTTFHSSIEHFQLRNLMSVPSHNTIQYSYESKIYSTIPAYNESSCLIDLSRSLPEYGFVHSVKISTMKSNHGVTIAGGFGGEYALRAEGTSGTGAYGFVTRNYDGITNHVEIIPHRTRRSPIAVFASNDNHIRILDCETNRFIADHYFLRAINCTDTSCDGRLRAIVGDSRTGWVVEAETGRPIQPLRGHRDFGFACAWSPDMRHIATSNQDKTVNIWDVRTWRVLTTIHSDVAGYRSLRFSPVGGGPRTLLMCEPADRISIVNAQTFQTRQVHDFFGEIAGADYTPDGGSIWVANSDDAFGGLMEFERRQWGQQYGLSFMHTPRKANGEFALYPDLPNEWLEERRIDDDERCVLSHGERQLRFMRTFSDRSSDDLII